MFAYNRQVAAYRAIAMLSTFALVLWGVGAHMYVLKAEAANLTFISDTLSDSDLSASSDHTIQFTTPTGMTAGQIFEVAFPAGFNMNSVAFGDVDIRVNNVDVDVAAAAAASTWGVTLSGQSLVFEVPSSLGDVAPGDDIEIQIGLNATNQVAGDTQIINPGSTNSYEITVGIAGTSNIADSGRTRVAILGNVLVTADVSTSFTFTVTGVADGASVNGSPTTTATTTTSTALPFENLSAGVSKTLAQDLAVTTNAANGFVVTVEQDSNLESSTGADIDGFINGAYTNSPTGWVAPSNIITDENTWGHWGLTTQDETLGELLTDDFGSDLWVSASTTPREIFRHDGPSDGTTPHMGATRIGYQVQITALQEAGDDYNTTLTYIATPTF